MERDSRGSPPAEDRATHPDQGVAGYRPESAAIPAPLASTSQPPARRWRKWLLLAAVVAGIAVGANFVVPWIVTALNTVSTDDAYVNGHVTFVAPRVAGQVSRVLVDDNYRVKMGDLLVQLDKEPFLVQVAIKQAAVAVAKTSLTAAEAQVRGQLAQARANRFKLEHAIEDVDNQVANLRAAVATLNSRKATLELARANLKRGEELAPSGGISKEELDQRRQMAKVDEAAVDQALQNIYAIRVGLGLREQPPAGHDLSEVPPNLDQDFSTVREALAALIQSAAQFGYFPTTWNATPKQAIAAFYKQDPEGNLDRIFAKLIPQAPAIKQAQANVQQAQSDLDQALLNLRYCDIVSEIDGVVTRRAVNPGNNVSVGQLVDLFPPGPLDPQGIHGALWSALGDESYIAPLDKPLTLAAYTAGLTNVAYVEPFAVGDALKARPLFLSTSGYVSVPLEDSYQAAYRGVPRRWQRVLEGSGA